MIVTFFGHRQFIKTEENERRLLELLEEIVGDETAEMYLGGYGNFDAFAYTCCKKYRKRNPKIVLVYVTPYLSIKAQTSWLCQQAQRYDAIVYPEIEGVPLRFAVDRRNRWMADMADYVICGIDHEWGGAYSAYRYAKRKGKTIYNLL